MDDLRGKRAIVSGSTRGIGRACAHEIARRGASVTLLARDEATAAVSIDQQVMTGGNLQALFPLTHEDRLEEARGIYTPHPIELVAMPLEHLAPV